jgi:hypothetical protein
MKVDDVRAAQLLEERNLVLERAQLRVLHLALLARHLGGDRRATILAAIDDAERALANRLAVELELHRIDARRDGALDIERHIDRAVDALELDLDPTIELGGEIELESERHVAALAGAELADARLGGQVEATIVAARRHGDSVVDRWFE